MGEEIDFSLEIHYSKVYHFDRVQNSAQIDYSVTIVRVVCSVRCSKAHGPDVVMVAAGSPVDTDLVADFDESVAVKNRHPQLRNLLILVAKDPACLEGTMIGNSYQACSAPLVASFQKKYYSAMSAGCCWIGELGAGSSSGLEVPESAYFQEDDQSGPE